jgi:hypothetical protein
MIKQTIDSGGLEREEVIVGQIMADDYTSQEIAAALVRLIQNRMVRPSGGQGSGNPLRSPAYRRNQRRRS